MRKEDQWYCDVAVATAAAKAELCRHDKLEQVSNQIAALDSA